MSTPEKDKLVYLITVSRNHLLPTVMLLTTLTSKTQNKIYLVGNLNTPERQWVEGFPIIYIDENDVDLSGRVPPGEWTPLRREWGWYKQQFLRLCADRYIQAEQIIILDSEVFVFDNWDESRFYTEQGHPKYFYWIAKKRKSDIDYSMYRGAAYLYRDLPGFSNVMENANSDEAKRYISGVSLFSTQNLTHIWDTLARQTDLDKNMRLLLSGTLDISFAEYQFYGLAVEYGLCDGVVKTELLPELLGWYDMHQDENFDCFRHQNPMWSMCQRYYDIYAVNDYKTYMQEVSQFLGKPLPSLRMPDKKPSRSTS